MLINDIYHLEIPDIGGRPLIPKHNIDKVGCQRRDKKNRYQDGSFSGQMF
jgi:hypothetical protein